MIRDMRITWILEQFQHFWNPPLVKCPYCGRKGLREEMVHLVAYGWFCSEEEADEFYWNCQW